MFKSKPTGPRLSKALNLGTKNAIKKAQDTIKKMTLATERFGKQLTPVDTGTLRGSISTSFGKGIIGFHGKVFTKLSYAPFVHWGTRRMRARPFLTEGKDIMLRKFTGIALADNISKEYRKAFIKL